MNRIQKYIIVDDDSFNNILCTIAIESALGKVDIISFSQPEAALKFIQNEYSESLTPAILFLDINMPTLTGWEFMEEYKKFSETIKKQISVYIVSSSVDHRDKDKAKADGNIRGFMSKPLEQAAIISVAQGEIQE